MNTHDEEYREIFYTEALDNHEELNRLFTAIKKPLKKFSVSPIRLRVMPKAWVLM